MPSRGGIAYPQCPIRAYGVLRATGFLQGDYSIEPELWFARKVTNRSLDSCLCMPSYPLSRYLSFFFAFLFCAVPLRVCYPMPKGVAPFVARVPSSCSNPPWLLAWHPRYSLEALLHVPMALMFPTLELRLSLNEGGDACRGNAPDDLSKRLRGQRCPHPLSHLWLVLLHNHSPSFVTYIT